MLLMPRGNSLCSDHQFKLILVGDSGVGKSSLLMRFADNAFSDSYISTIGVDFRFRTIKLNGKIIRLQIWDTAGQERFRNMTSAFCRGVDGIVFVYDVTNVSSFQHVEQWLSTVDRYSNEGASKILIGNKCDLSNRVVSREEAEMYAQKLDISFIETSAKNSSNIMEAFQTITLELIKNKERSKKVAHEGINQSFQLKQEKAISEEQQTESTGCCFIS